MDFIFLGIGQRPALILLIYCRCFFISGESVYGVDCTGVHLFDRQRSKKEKSYKFTEISQFGANQESFWLSLKKGNTDVTVYTENPWSMYSLIYDYIKYLKRGDLKRTRRRYDRSTVLVADVGRLDDLV